MKRSKELREFCDVLCSFQDELVNKASRQAVYALITGAVASGLMHRYDKGREVHLYHNPAAHNFGMQPDVTVTTLSDRFFVCTDGLDGTIMGLIEFEEEEEIEFGEV